MKKTFKRTLSVLVLAVLAITSVAFSASAGHQEKTKSTSYGTLEGWVSFYRQTLSDGTKGGVYNIGTYIPKVVDTHYNKMTVKYNSGGTWWDPSAYVDHNCKQGGSLAQVTFWATVPTQKMSVFGTNEIRHSKSYVIYTFTTF